jgi:hypothetical protein
MTSKQDLERYLSEHLAYERKMLGHTYEKLSLPLSLDWCAYFESFGIHARNIYHFLRHDGTKNTTIRADHYVPQHKKPESSHIDPRMNESFFHLSTKRLDGKPVNLQDAIDIGVWLDREWKSWASMLPDNFRVLVDVRPVCVFTTIYLSGTKAATNHITTSSSSF